MCVVHVCCVWHGVVDVCCVCVCVLCVCVCVCGCVCGVLYMCAVCGMVL